MRLKDVTDRITEARIASIVNARFTRRQAVAAGFGVAALLAVLGIGPCAGKRATTLPARTVATRHLIAHAPGANL